MVFSVIQNIRAALKYRGGWKGLLEHMYTNGDYPFKFGTYMGCDLSNNRYYENTIDYPHGQHRWVEPGDIHNFDSTSIPPEWQGWMTHTTDIPPSDNDSTRSPHVYPKCRSNSPLGVLGHQDYFQNIGNLHNISSVRSRGYNIGNNVTGLSPDNMDGYYTQPGSPYNTSDGTTGVVKRYTKDEPKNNKWKKRLMTKKEVRIEQDQRKKSVEKMMNMIQAELKSPKELAIANRGGII